IPIFIGASPLFEVIHYIQIGTINNLTNLLLLVLLVGIQLIFNKQRIVKLSFIIRFLWSTAQLGLSLIYDYAKIFNYLIHPLYCVIIIILAIYCLIKKGTWSE